LEPAERLASVAEATLEVRRASVFGEAIIAIVYLPILAFIGVEGKLFRPMATTVLLALALFFRIGTEFVPQLDEGDLLLEARRLPGIALDESVATSLRLEAALKEIPEVTHVVSRTGAPEVATDPMGMEQSDVYIGLKERSQWRSGMSKEQLALEISEAAAENVP